MSHAVRRITEPSAAPNSPGEPPPTTATVVDYSCLFTHDLRRKQKRWQDGKLKYHTFNKRVMVYDDRGNFIGDAHWPGAGDLQEDEELELDRGAAIVQVGEYTGSREQDLTEVLDKRAREVEKRRAMAAAKTPTPSRARAQQRPHFQLNHRPLSSIVPSPGPIGRSVIPDRSPFEARKAEGGADGPSSKKRRVSPSPPSKAGFAQNLFGARLNLGGSGGRVLKLRALRERTNFQGEPAEGAKGQSVEGDEDVVIVDERRSKVLVKKSKQPCKSTMRETTSVVEVMTSELAPTTVKEGATFNTAKNMKTTGLVSLEIDDRPRSNKMQISRPTNVQLLPMETCTADDRRPTWDTDRISRCNGNGASVKAASTTAQDVVLVEEQPHAVKRQEVLASDVDHSNLRSKAEPRVVEPCLARPAGRQNCSPHKPMEDTTVTVEPQATNTISRNNTPDSHVEGIDIETSPGTTILKKTVHRELDQGQSVADEIETSRSPQSVSSTTRPGQRAELRIKPGRRRGLLMVSERRQESHRQPTSAKLTSYAHNAEPSDSENAAPSKSLGFQNSGHDGLFDQDFEDLGKEQTVEALPKPSPQGDKFTSLELDLKHRSDVSTSKSSWRDSSKQTETTSEPNGSHQPRKQQHKYLNRSTIAECSSEPESSDNSPARQRSQVRRKPATRYNLGFSADEEEICHSPPRNIRRKKIRDASESPPAGFLSAENAEQPPARQSERTHNGLSHVTEKPEPKGPRIMRMARKSVKCKEIFGFIPPTGEEELIPAPFVIADGRIGTVGRPPAAPTRLPGITLTMKSGPVVSAHSISDTSERKSRETDGKPPMEAAPKEAITGLSAKGDSKKSPVPPDPVSKSIAITKLTVEEAESVTAVTKEKISVEQGSVSRKLKISNPATRGRKAARKEDAAGRAPQPIVPFEVTHPVRPPRLPEPDQADLALPGFTSAKGGAWSRHAEEMLE
ncbi:hypothetical protein ED733_002767 [Metarhizium rileyi]|uniref:5'-3' DNA helicase ZGRF1-like N-terminal domain-containing protein n=1 Tax=Metarhizium rileyi (strain RCEF 4871) TaxID=1649241 RepID=A0A5C6GAR5_METRR|nr:hypothetical protein ED733_002767 [Metarhizium rileyi]